MTPDAEQRIRAAMAELADALVAATERTADTPDPLLSVAEAADAARISRTLFYRLLGTGKVRSVSLGRRRLVPLSAIAELAQSPPGADK